MQTATISVSRAGALNCGEVAAFLKASCGLDVSVVSTVSTTPHGVEKGCRITRTIETKQEVGKMWSALKPKYGFQCAHVNAEGRFSGCILDFLSPTLCDADC